jgi:hypothetical protein
MTKRALQPYLSNVRNAVFRNVNGLMEHIEEEEEDIAAEIFLLAIIDYCTSLLNDPSKRKKKRVKTRHGSGSSAKEVINA